MRVVVTTPLTVTLSLDSEPEPSPLLGTLTSTLLWSSTSVMGLTKLSAWWKGSDNSSDGWMTLHMCKRGCKLPSTHRLAWCLGMSLHLSHFISSFSSCLVTCLTHITTVVMTATKYCLP
jgi:hypothetical protein